MSKARRGRGEGSIYLRQDGRYCASLSLGFGANGKRQRRVVYGKNKREVLDQLAEIQGQAAAGQMILPQKVTLGQFFPRWLNDSHRHNIGDTTHRTYGTMARLHILPHLGKIQLSQITPATLLALYAHLERQGLAPGTRTIVHTVLRMCLQQAVEWSMILRNPCALVKGPRRSTEEMKVWQPPEVEQFLAAARSEARFYPLFLLALTTGMRLGELCGLQWADIDLQAGYLMVRRTVSDLGGKRSVRHPKTKGSRRRIDLPPMVLAVLAAHRRAALVKGSIGAATWLFPTHRGDCAWPRWVSGTVFHRLVAAAGVQRIRFHDMRHTAATLMLLQGIHIKVVSEILGHSNVAITLNRYSHVLPSMQREAAAKMETLFSAMRTEPEVKVIALRPAL